MSSASADDRAHCRANSSRPGAIWEKQVFQFSSVATFSMTCSRSFIIKTPPNSVFVSNSGRFFSDVVTAAVSGGRNQTNVPAGEDTGSYNAGILACLEAAG